MARRLRGLRVQSPSLTPNETPARSVAGAGRSRQARKDLIGSLRARGLSRKRAEAHVETIDVLADAMAAVEATIVLEIARGL